MSQPKYLNELKTSFPSLSENERLARLLAGSFFSSLDPLADEISDIKTALSEAVTNCIVHAYKNHIGRIELTFRILPERRIYIKIKDRGCGIENIKQAMQPLFTTSGDEERAGLGFAVMESFTDEVIVRSKPDRGTTVILKKKLCAKETKNGR